MGANRLQERIFASAAISSIDYDFWGWAVERWDRAKARMDSSDFHAWLRVLKTSD